MAKTTNIGWCDSTFTPWIGCTNVSRACDHCYAERYGHRFGIKWGPGQPRKRTSPAYWRQPLLWNAKPFYECQKCGWRGDNPDRLVAGSFVCRNCESSFIKQTRRRVFCGSLCDVFDNEVDVLWRSYLAFLIEKTPYLDWLLPTKRIGNVPKLAPLPWLSKSFQHGPDPNNICTGGWPSNVWLGATICNQEEADRDIPKLLAVPAAKRFLSIEPMLEAIQLWKPDCDWSGPKLDWVICGGESGPHARPMHPDWARALRDQCVAAGVPFFFKQWGTYCDEPEWSDQRDTHLGRKIDLDGTPMYRIGKKAAGRLLDGRTWEEVPA